MHQSHFDLGLIFKKSVKPLQIVAKLEGSFPGSRSTLLIKLYNSIPPNITRPHYIMSQASFKKRLKALMNKPENQVCSDCPERQPRWASLIVPPPGSPPGSLPIGAFCCLECSGSHRRLGVHISFVRSVTLDSCKLNESSKIELNRMASMPDVIYFASMSTLLFRAVFIRSITHATLSQF